MTIDINKLVPAPIGHPEYHNDVGPNDEGFWEWYEVSGVKFDSKDDANFYVLARNAFEVMMRRGWTVACEWSDHGKFIINGWHVVPPCGKWNHYVTYPDPFTALVGADAWYKANVEKKEIAQ